MNRTLGIAATLVTLAVVGVLIANLTRQTQDMTTGTADDSPASTTEDKASQLSQDSSGSSGQYVPYTGDLAIGSGRRILFFHAPWCPQCRALEESIKTEGVPDGVTILKVDYDSNQILRRRYGVTIQTTLVEISESGDLIERVVAYQEPTMATILEEFDLR